jgi:predicted kinase
MFTIELTLKHTAMPLSVQKKEKEAADALYSSLVNELRSGGSPLIELTCDQQPHKKIAVLASELAAVQIFEKTSTATASGRPPGFFALSAEQ